MNWNTENDPAFLGMDADRILAECATAQMLGEWPENTVKRCKLASGDAAWLAITKGGLACVAIAPWASVHDAPYVPAGDMYSMPWPETWRTKWREGMKRPAPKREVPTFKPGDFAVAVGAGKKGGATLCRVIAVGAAGMPLTVQPGPEAPEMPADAFSGRRWADMSKWPDGAAELWRRHWVVMGHFGNMARWAGILQNNLKGKRGQKSAEPERKGVLSDADREMLRAAFKED